jgi:2-oxo-4-hydroxy-4-carboxy-5-ureidoimidazoline decarboxylase
MSELHTVLNALSDVEASRALHTCCAADRWVKGMVGRLPFGAEAGVLIAASELWHLMERTDILEAFKGHPQIGGDLAVLREKYAASSDAATLSMQEQASVAAASDEELLRLRDGNAAYLRRFGFIFIVCASGKTAAQILELLELRLLNAPEHELEIAASEQEKILLLRLRKLAT